MTDRERWTVYPLLFLALGVSLKDKLTRSVNVDEIRCKAMICNELLVNSAQGTGDLRVAGGNLQADNLVCNAMTVADAKGQQRVSITNGGVQAASMICGALVVADANGKEAVAISTNEHGGFVRTHGKETGTISFLGNTERIAGLLFIDSQGAVHPGPYFASPAPAEKSTDSSPPPPATTEDGPEEKASPTQPE